MLPVLFVLKKEICAMPKAKKKSNGTWRVTVYDYKDSAGKIHQKTFTAATKREAERLANAYKDGPRLSDLTVGEAVLGYIDSKKAVLSPSTHRSYMSMYRTHFESSLFGSLKLVSLDNISAQRFISDLDLKPKTVRNIAGLLTASIIMYCPEKHFTITLPANRQPDLHTPTTEEVERLIATIRDTDRELYICVMLCAFAPMRRSEACGIRYEDIDYEKNTIHIKRARVYNDQHKWIYKEMPKTDSSCRTVSFPAETIKVIGRGFGYVITKSSPQALSERLTRVLESASLPHFRMHDLRHYGASILHTLMPDQYVLQRGGWKTDSCYKRIYRDTLSDVQVEMNQKAVDYFEQRLNQ